MNPLETDAIDRGLYMLAVFLLVGVVLSIGGLVLLGIEHIQRRRARRALYIPPKQAKPHHTCERFPDWHVHAPDQR